MFCFRVRKMVRQELKTSLYVTFTAEMSLAGLKKKNTSVCRFLPGGTVFTQTGWGQELRTPRTSPSVIPKTGVPPISRMISPTVSPPPGADVMKGNSPQSAPPPIATPRSPDEPSDGTKQSCTLERQCFFTAVLDMANELQRKGEENGG